MTLENVWTPPASYPATPSYNADDGYPEPSGVDIEEQYYNTGTKRENRRLYGVNFYDTGTTDFASTATVDAGRFNDMRKTLYRAFKRLRRLLVLAVGPQGWQERYAYEGDLYTNFAFVYELTASGSGTSLTVSWADGDGEDLRSLERSANSAASTAVQPGLFAMDARTGSFGMAEIQDVTLTGETGGLHYATITLDKPLNANRFGKLYIIREHDLRPFPSFRLDYPTASVSDPRPCLHAVKTHHSVFSSFASQYPDADMAAGIDGDWFCAKMNERTASELSEFEAECNNTACTGYVAHTPYYPDPDDLGGLFLERGFYTRMISNNPATYVVGRRKWSGLFQLFGLPIGYFVSGLPLYPVTYAGLGAIKYKTGDTTDAGYAEFLDWLEHQDKRVDEGNDEADNVGMISELSTVSKRDPAGGTSDITLEDRGGKTPGYDIEAAVGIRRMTEMGFGGHGATQSGDGDARIQRVRPRRYTSKTFDPAPASGQTITDEEGEVRTFTSGQSYTDGTSFTYTAVYQIPRFGERTGDARARYPKSPATPQIGAYNIDNSTDVLRLDFKAGDLSVSYEASGDLYTQNAKCGGSTVCPELAHEPYNPGCVQRSMGDRQAKLYPGDVIYLDHDDLRNIGVQCIGAEAMAGADDPDAVEPRGGVPGIPQYVRDNYAKMDRAWFDLSGRSGQMWKEQVGTLIDDGATQIERICYDAAAPPMRAHDGTTTRYDSAISLAFVKDIDDSVTTLVESAEYVFDPVTGKFYVDLSGYSDTGNLHAQLWVYDRRRNHPCENAEALNEAVTAACAGYIQVGLSTQKMGLNLQTIDADGSELFAHVPLMEPGISTEVKAGTTNYTTFSYTSAADWAASVPVVWHEDWTDGVTEPEQKWVVDEDISQTADASTTYTQGIGLIWTPDTAGSATNPPKYGLVYDNTAQIISITGVNRWRSVEVAQAYINLEVQVFAAVHELAWTLSGGGNWTSSTTPSDFSDVTLVAVQLGADVNYVVTEFQSSDVSATVSFNEVNEDGNTYWRATVDATDLFKWLCDNTAPVGAAHTYMGLMLSGPDIPAPGDITESDARRLAAGWVDEWSWTFSGGSPTAATVSVRRFEYSGMTAGPIYVKPVAGELGNAADYHFDAYGQEDAPDLLASAQA